MPAQLILPLESPPSLGRADFIVAPANAQAIALIDSWPSWPVKAAAIIGPAGSGKSHLAAIWRSAAGAQMLAAAALGPGLRATGPVIIEDVDGAPANPERDEGLFAQIEGASVHAPILLTGREHPSQWAFVMPDLHSRFLALPSFPLWAPDDALLAALAAKLFADRQLSVPKAVIDRMLHSLERNPESVRKFVARADARALSEGRAISVALVRELVAEEDQALS